VVAVEQHHAHAGGGGGGQRVEEGQQARVAQRGRAEPGEEGVAQHEERVGVLRARVGHEAHGTLHAGGVAAVQVQVRKEEGTAHRAGGARPGVPPTGGVCAGHAARPS
jgi:hypothetical protein